MEIKLNKGQGVLGLEIPDHKISDILNGRDVPALGHDRVRQIIEDGVSAHTPDRIGGRKIAVIIPDNTRLWARGDLFVPHIVQTLMRLGAKKEDITIIIALGTHKDIDADGFAELAGEYCAQNIRIVNSANVNKDRLTRISTTTRNTQLTITTEAARADHIIIFGGVLHHMLAGFGGGRKYILPGIAGYDAIQQNHSLSIRENGTAHPHVRQGRLEGNPVHEDMTEAAKLFLKDKTATYVAVAANGNGEIFHCAVGDVDSTFTTACRTLDEACCIPVTGRADFALISTGGHRTDTQLYQSTKALFNAVGIVKEGGHILFVAGCADGIGNETFGRTLTEYRDDPGRIGKELVQSFNMPAYVAFRVMDILDRYHVTLYSDLPDDLVTKMGFSVMKDPDRYIGQLSGQGVVMPHAENILPVLKH